MTFFFDKRPSLRSQWMLKTKLAQDDSMVVLSHDLWHTLNPPTDSQRLCISLTLVDSRNEPNRDASIVCWASLNEEVSSWKKIAIPHSWLKVYPHVFGSSPYNELFVTLTTPIVLTSVIFVSLSSEAYSNAVSNYSAIEESFYDDRAILRQGDIFNVPNNLTSASNSVFFQYRLEMLEPVLQGCAKRGETKLLLLSSLDDRPLLDDISDEDDDAIEIGEDFLGSSILSTTRSPTLHEHNASSGQRTGLPPESSPVGYVPKALSSPCNLLDDHCTLYLRTNDLGKIGILSGDWAIAGVKPTNSRLVRIVANDDLVDSAGIVTGSPLLIHNSFADEVEAYSSQPLTIHIHPSPFGSFNPSIPIARSITIARVASPVSTNRLYQSLFIGSLKAYFDSERKLVKQGDLIVVSIDTNSSRLIPEQDSTPSAPEEDANQSRYPNCESRANEIVFFKVTNIEYDIMSQSTSFEQDMYTGSTLGELGCWVDTSITRMIQTGIEYCRVPSMESYLNIDSTRINILSRTATLSYSCLIGPGSPFSKILSLASAALSQRAMDYDLQLAFLLKGGRSIGKFTVASWVAQKLGLHLFEVDCYDIIGETDVKTEALLQVRLDQARSCTPCLLVLRHLEAFSQTTQAPEPGKEPAIVNVLRESLQNMQTNWKLTGYPVIVLGTTTESGRVPPSLLSCFKQEIAFEAPNEAERHEIITCLLADQKVASDVSLQNLATQTAALLAGDLGDLVARAKTASFERTSSTMAFGRNEASLQQIPLIAADFDVALGKARDSYSESIGAPKIPTVSWDDVGGLAHVKTDILDTIQLPLDHPELFVDGLKKRSGILLYGPPGTGKTLIAKAVATSCSLNFFSVKGPELLNMYIGESEANVRRVFQRARDAKPCVIFFDELDSVAPKRGNHGDSGGVMDRIVSQLLAELDGMSGGKEGADVFVIGATNRPDLLDPALLRPGRFDRMLYLGVSDTHEAQLNILDALTRKFKLDPKLDLHLIAEKCPFNYTGADFYALCSDAMLNAMSRKAEFIEEKLKVLNTQPGSHSHPHPITPQYYLAELASPDEINVYVSAEDFERALAMLVPSVSQAEMDHYAEVQKRFSQPATKEDEDDSKK